MPQIGGRPRPGSREYRAQTRPRPIPRRRAPKPAREPVGVFRHPVKAPSFRPAQRQARRRVERARSGLPQQRVPLPQPPVLRHPTAAQRRLAASQRTRGVQQRRFPGETAAEAKGRLLRTGTAQQRVQVHRLTNQLRREARLPAQRRALAYRESIPSQLRPYRPPHRGAGTTVATFVNKPFAAVANRFGASLAESGATGVGARFLQDLVSFPANVIPSTYALGSAGVQAAAGNARPLRELGSQFANTDPFVLLARGRPKQALKAAGEHPGIAALELYGGLGAADRLAGFAARGGRAPGLRPLRGVPNTNLVEPRRYSKGFVVSRAQRRADVRDARKFEQFRTAARAERQRAHEAAARGDHAAVVRHEANAQRLVDESAAHDPVALRGSRTVDVRGRQFEFGQNEIRRRADEMEALAQARRRPHRAEAVQSVLGRHAVRPSRRRGAVVGRGAEAEVQGWLAEGRVLPTRGDLAKYADELRSVRPSLPRSQRATNRRLEQAAREVLASGADLGQLAMRGREFARVQRAVEEKAIRAGALGREEARMARLKRYAARHMGARQVSGRERGPTVLAAAERAANEAVAASEKRLAPLRARAHAARQAEAAAEARATALATAKRRAQRSGRAAKGPDLTRMQGERLMRAQGDRLVAERALARAEAEHGRLVQVAKAARTTKAERHQGSAFVGMHGNRLTADQIEAHMRANGLNPEEIAFVSGSGRAASNAAFNVSARRPQGLSTATRTERGVTHGTASAGRESQVGTVVGTQGVLDAAQSYAESLGQAALRNEAGKVIARSKPRAQQLARESGVDEHGLPVPGAVEMTAVPANPFRGRESQLQQTLDVADAEGFVGGADHPLSEAVASAWRGEGGGGMWVVVPKEFARQMERHALVYTSSNPWVRSYFNLFRMAVLPFSPTWLTGNAAESALRTGVAHAGPRSWWTQRQTLRILAEQDPKALEDLLLRVGGGHYAMADRSTVHATAAQFSDSSIAPVAQAFIAARNAPGVKQLGDLASAVTHWMTGTVNGSMEAFFKRVMLGKYIREYVIPPGMPKLSRRAVEEAARGLTNTQTQVEMARMVRRAYGKYEAFSPEARKWLINYTPFGAWARNAVEFVLSVLPRDHPALVGLLAANDQATRTWRQDHGQDKGSKGMVPPFLLGSIPAPAWYAKLTGVAPGSPVRAARYTPFGFWTDPLGTAAQQVLPEFSGALSAFEGREFPNREIRGPGGGPPTDAQKAWIAVRESLLSTVPAASMVWRGVTQKEGSVGSRVRQVVNPFEPSHGAAYTASSSGSGGAFSGGGFDWGSSAPGGGFTQVGGFDWGGSR